MFYQALYLYKTLSPDTIPAEILESITKTLTVLRAQGRPNEEDLQHSHNQEKVFKLIMEYLSSQSLDCVPEYQIDDFYFVDIYIPNKKICIEIDGLSHYATLQGSLNQKSKVKRKVLEKLGYKVANLDLTDYLNKRDENFKQNILEKLVNDIIN